MRNLLTIAALLFALAAHAQGTGPMRPDQNIPFSGSNTFTGQNSTPSCTLSTTTGAIGVTAAPPCSASSADGTALNLVGPLTGAATLGFPTGLVDGVSMGFVINHGTGANTLTFASGYIFPSSSLSGGQPSLTNTADAVDLVFCESANAPLPGTVSPSVLSMWCGPPPLNMTPVQQPPVVTASAISTIGAGTCASSGTTCSVTITLPTAPFATASVLGSLLKVGVSNSSGTALSSGSSIAATAGPGTIGTCTADSGATGTGFSGVYTCPITGAGSVTVQATWPSTVTKPSIGAAVAANVINANEQGTGTSGTSTSLSITGGATTQPDLIFAIGNSLLAVTFSAFAGCTELQSNAQAFIASGVQSSPGTFSCAATQSINTGWSMSISAAKP